MWLYTLFGLVAVLFFFIVVWAAATPWEPWSVEEFANGDYEG